MADHAPPGGAATPAPAAPTPAPAPAPAPKPAEPPRPTYMDVDIDDGVLIGEGTDNPVRRYSVTVQVTDQNNNGIKGTIWISGLDHTVDTTASGFFFFECNVPVKGYALQVKLAGTRASDHFTLLGPKPPRPTKDPLPRDSSLLERFLRGWQGYKE